MKVTLTHDGKSVELDLTTEQMAALGLKEEKKNTGYEKGTIYCYVTSDNHVVCIPDSGSTMDLKHYNNANYYTLRSIAEANARADLLMRRLRRFAAENGGIPSVEDWKPSQLDVRKFEINYDYNIKELEVYVMCTTRVIGSVYFNTREACEKAIELYRDELTWYFTEYEAMLR